MREKVYFTAVAVFISTINISVINAQSCCGTPGRSKALAKYVEEQKGLKEGKEIATKEKNSKEKSTKPKSKE